jgi:hypothetical protein
MMFFKVGDDAQHPLTKAATYLRVNTKARKQAGRTHWPATLNTPNARSASLVLKAGWL